MKILYIFFLILLLLPTVHGIETTRECLNSTHLKTIMKWTKCDTTCQDYNITQVTDCTSGCDTVNNICKYTAKASVADISAMFGVSFSSLIFLFLGFRLEKGNPLMGVKDVFMRNGLKVLFTSFGLWLLLITLATADSILAASGAAQNTIQRVGNAITVLTYGIYLFLVIFMLAFLYTVLMTFLEAGKGRRGRR